MESYLEELRLHFGPTVTSHVLEDLQDCQRYLRGRSCPRTSFASSNLPTEARYLGESGRNLMPASNIRAGKHWNASKKRHLTADIPLSTNESPKSSMISGAIIHSLRKGLTKPVCDADTQVICDEHVSKKAPTVACRGHFCDIDGNNGS